MASFLGTLFRITTFGESHGKAVGVVIDGCPPRFPLSIEDIQAELDRRRPGQSSLVSQRKESDTIHILSGMEDGLTLGTPILLMVNNEDARPKDYDEMAEKFRPSHADYAYVQKYGIRAASGGGRASARETVGRVAAGAVAKQLLRARYGVEVLAFVQSIASLSTPIDPNSVTQEMVESTPVRCPDSDMAQQMISLIEEARKNGDSLGGVIALCAKNVPAGWGEPVFDKLEADLAKAMLSLPACKGFESGSGFAGTLKTGSQHADEFRSDAEKHVTTLSNNSGGIQGGISNGMPILCRMAFKPTATVMTELRTVDVEYENTTIKGRGRHDPCVLPRAVPMVEAMAALVLIDHALRHEAQCGNC
ncbi:MAG: chorismate synthase [Armatimonadetes bacterium]|nr:chorismate synthase [Armatimonadota bacterium]